MRQNPITRSALVGLMALGCAVSSEMVSAGVVDASARITVPTIPGPFDQTYSPTVSGISHTIDEVVTVGGGPTGTIAGRVEVEGTTEGEFSLLGFGQQSIWDVESSFGFTETIDNTSPEAQAFAMDFRISAGALDLRAFELLPGPGQSMTAGYEARIRVNGVEVFVSTATLRFGSSPTLVTGGTDLGGSLATTTQRRTYSWGDFLGTLDLGVLDAGESLTLDYTMRTFTSADFRCGSSEFSTCGQGTARIGDPLSFSQVGVPGSITTSPVVAGVPEPGALSLVALGLVGGLAARRKGSASS
ncbi:MAG: PEP-CTERM sorting domain-containing protein [Ectothiorhodospiraceae bacterium]|nr:PEP-CTERM sorting domain-containing protein [Ectothiorhodospiraceae bacterium]